MRVIKKYLIGVAYRGTNNTVNIGSIPISCNKFPSKDGLIEEIMKSKDVKSDLKIISICEVPMDWGESN